MSKIGHRTSFVCINQPNCLQCHTHHDTCRRFAMTHISVSKTAQILADCRSLWDAVFADPAVYSEHYFTHHCRDNTILTLYDGARPDTLMSMLHMNPYTLYIHGVELSGYYIVGVATRPESRHQGCMRTLLEKMFALCSSSHIPFVYLMPAKPEIYEPFDFHTVCKQQIYHGTREFLSDTVPFLSLSEEYQKKVVDFAEQRLSGQYQIYTRRSLSYYITSALEMRACGGDLLVRLSGENVCSIITYSNEEQIEIMDYCGILHEDASLLPLQNPPLIMARVTDFTALAKYMRSSAVIDTTVQILDTYIPENNRCFHLQVDSHQGMAVPVQTKTPEQIIPVSEVFDVFFHDCTWHINEIV